MSKLKKRNLINVRCPICKIDREIEFPTLVINQAKQLTTVSIPKGFICDHHFQAFIDKNFKIRGYQKVDFEMPIEKSRTQKHVKKGINTYNEDESDLFKNLIMEGNFIEYNPKKISKEKKLLHNKEEVPLKKKRMTLKEIYEEFWEFIDDDIEIFQEFILKDKRRKISLNNLL